MGRGGGAYKKKGPVSKPVYVAVLDKPLGEGEDYNPDGRRFWVRI